MKKFGIGIIGAGGRGSGFVSRIASAHGDEAKVVGLADPNDVRMRGALTRASIECELFTDPKDMLRRKDIDAVFITTPDYLHEEVALAALKAGKHIFVDKPLATTVKGCLNIVRAARRSRKMLYMELPRSPAPKHEWSRSKSCSTPRAL